MEFPLHAFGEVCTAEGWAVESCGGHQGGTLPSSYQGRITQLDRRFPSCHDGLSSNLCLDPRFFNTTATSYENSIAMGFGLLPMGSVEARLFEAARQTPSDFAAAEASISAYFPRLNFGQSSARPFETSHSLTLFPSAPPTFPHRAIVPVVTHQLAARRTEGLPVRWQLPGHTGISPSYHRCRADRFP